MPGRRVVLILNYSMQNKKLAPVVREMEKIHGKQ